MSVTWEPNYGDLHIQTPIVDFYHPHPHATGPGFGAKKPKIHRMRCQRVRTRLVSAYSTHIDQAATVVSYYVNEKALHTQLQNGLVAFHELARFIPFLFAATLKQSSN